MERISVKLSALQKKTISEVQKASIWTTHRVQFSTPMCAKKPISERTPRSNISYPL